MYIKNELLHNNSENKKSHLKDLLINTIEQMGIALDNKELDKSKCIETISCINAFNKINNFEPISYNLITMSTPIDFYILVKRYYESFLHEHIDLHFFHFEESTYHFDDVEYNTIQESLNKLRDDLHKTKLFDDEHKQRLLDKLENLQKELHKKMTTLDKTLGQLVLIATALGTAGEKAKPMFDRINETIKSVLRVQNKKDKIIKDEAELDYNPFSKIDSKYTSNNDTETDIA